MRNYAILKQLHIKFIKNKEAFHENHHVNASL